MNITAKELSGMHLGKPVIIKTKDGETTTGTITEIIQRNSETIEITISGIAHISTEQTPITIQEGE